MTARDLRPFAIIALVGLLIPIGARTVAIAQAFPDNSRAPKSAFVTPGQVLQELHFAGTPSRIEFVRKGNRILMSWSEVNTDGARVTYISPNRQVYEVQATFDSPFGSGGNIYSSGRETIVIDAATGRVLSGRTTGHRTSSNLPKTQRTL